MTLRASCRSLYVAVVFSWALSRATRLAAPWGTLAWMALAGMAPITLYLAARVRAMVEHPQETYEHTTPQRPTSEATHPQSRRD